MEAALESRLISRVMVSTDSEVYAGIARLAGAEVPFIRPEHLSADHTPSIDVVIHALEYYAGNGENFDAVCILQPTSPFRKRGAVDHAIARFTESGADALVSVIPVPHEYNPHWTFEPADNGFLRIATGEKEIIRRRQALPPAYIRDGSIYLTKTEVVLHQKSLYGSSISYVENDPESHVNIDTETDWQKAELKADHFFRKKQG